MTNILISGRLLRGGLATSVMLVLACVLFVPKEKSAESCADPVTDCKNAHYIGKPGNCVCFSCENPDKDHLKSICTSNDTDKLTLFESEAAKRKPEIRVNKFLPEWRNTVTALMAERINQQSNKN